MLELEIVFEEGFKAETNEFIATKSETIQLEHSLFSLSKWEAKWEIAFYGRDEKTNEQLADYIRMMVLSDISFDIVEFIKPAQIAEINEYINSKQTASWFAEDNRPGRRGARNTRVTTSDLLYAYMASMRIPFECQHWHINRLLTLIRIIDLENQPKKNMPRRDSVASHRSINQARRAANGG